MEQVTYRKQGVIPLEDFGMTIWADEILGLVSVNHLGLFALVRLLQQNLPLHYGYVYYKERPVNDWHLPRIGMSRTIVSQTAIDRTITNRVSVVRNRGCLAEGLTVADNIFVLRPGLRKRLMQLYILREQLRPFTKDIEVGVPASTYVEELTNLERFVVKLLKAVVVDNHLVVLEDIGTFIDGTEPEQPSGILHHYAKEGMSFLYIAAHLEEARRICSWTTPMLNRQIIKCFQAEDKAPDPSFLHCTEGFDHHMRKQMSWKPRPEESRIVFQVEGEPAFSVIRGECLVTQDLDNCMIQELPVHSMLFFSLSHLDNPCFTLDYWIRDMWGGKRVKESLCQEYAELLGEEVFDLPMDRLTGWQKYDLIYTHVCLQDPKVVFCVQPLKSTEVALRVHIAELLKRFLSKGVPIVIMTMDLVDSLVLADRLLRVRRGGKVQEYHKDEFAALPVNTPWLYLYQGKYREERWDDVDGWWGTKEWQAEQLS